MDPALHNVSDVATILGTIFALGGIFYAVLRRIRLNDLLHLDLKLDELSRKVDDLHEDVRQSNQEMHRHLEWHSQWNQHRDRN